MSIIQNLTQTGQAYIIDGKTLNVPEGAAKPLELKTGSSIQGTVISVTDADGGKVANISVGDSVISAKLSEDMGLREGQTLNFAIRSTVGGKVAITPLYENTSVEESTLKALNAAGIDVTRDSIDMVKNMMEAGLPIGKDALLSMNKNLNMFPNSSISTMVEMKSLNIPITDKNIIQFESYKNYEHQVIGQLNDFMDELPKALSDLMASGNEEGAVKLYEAVLKEIAGSGPEAAGAGATASADAAATQTSAAEGQNPVSGADTTAAEGQNPVAGIAQNAVAENAVAESATALDPNKELAAGIASNAAETAAVAEGPQTAAGDSDGVAAGTEATENVAGASSGENVAGASTGTANLSPELRSALKNVGVSDEAINRYIENAKDDPGIAAKELLKELYSATESGELAGKASAGAIKTLFSNNEYNKILKDAISSEWLLKPDDVQKKENIDNLYQRLNSQMKGLSQAIANTVGAESKLGQVAGNIQNNLDFINQLNQMFQYVQLPLRMAGQNVHGDLYVYRNKHKKISEDGSVSAVLHLDMEHLGPVDVYVKMLNNKVSTNFYVADDAVLDLINDNIYILNERLEKRGYSMQVKMMLHDDITEGDAAVDEMLSVSRNTLISTSSFDARA
ncbi:MAG: flagellar hook-length control protein FliK [Butyrivibrio sp.]|nr:flagellar hook-length control protein FliK [Butyrivibrio sp.]